MLPLLPPSSFLMCVQRFPRRFPAPVDVRMPDFPLARTAHVHRADADPSLLWDSRSASLVPFLEKQGFLDFESI